MAVHRFFLIETLQPAVMPFVEAPGFFLRNPHEIHFFEREPESLDRTLQYRSVGDVEYISAGAHQPSSLARFLDTFVTKPDVRPTGKPVFHVPHTFAMPQQNESFHRHSDSPETSNTSAGKLKPADVK